MRFEKDDGTAEQVYDRADGPPKTARQLTDYSDEPGYAIEPRETGTRESARDATARHLAARRAGKP